ncbi:MAG: hypothetical protein JSU95_05545 [Betaproteobacteria bacterium]|nr:MAG: hypothetical protein JSU95_05545 [Betaproteobacteria bacterium]
MAVGQSVRAGFVICLLITPLLANGDEFQGEDPDQRALKEASVSRLAHSLDPAMPVAVGKVVVRQQALLRARELLAQYGRRAGLDEGWNSEAPEWQQAERELTEDAFALIDSKIAVPEWFYAVQEREIAKVLDAEEADYIATHFTTPIGREQRILLQMRLLAEVLMTNYSFTNRIDSNLPGLENDLAELSSAYWDMEPFRKRDFMTDPEAIKFAGQAAGLKYTRMLAIDGIEGFIAHIDAVAAEARQAVDNAEPLIDDYIEMYRQRTGARRS